MKIRSIKTKRIIPKKDKDIFLILDKYLPKLKERSIVAVTSKIIAICQERIADPEKVNKDDLAEEEADFYLPRNLNKYNFMLTIKNNTMIASAGIDESNAADYLILWPEDPQESADQIRTYIKKKFKLNNIGVIITDSKLTPLRWGVTGVSIAHSGFSALNDYRKQPDIFGRKLKITQVNVAEALAVSAVLLMGEGKEQTPIAIIEDIPFVKFQKRNPTKKELKDLQIDLKEDVYGSILTAVKWKKGKGFKKHEKIK